MNKNSSKSVKYFIATSIYVVIVVLAVIFGLLPEVNKLSKNQKDLSKAKQDLADTTDKRTNLENLSKDQSKLDLVSNVTQEYLPSQPNTSDFVVKVEALAKQLNIVISSFSFTDTKTDAPKKSSSEENSSTSKSTSSSSSDSSSSSSSNSQSKTSQKAPQDSSEFTIIVNANYNQIQQFLEKMESFPRVNVVDNLNVSGFNKEKDTLTLKVVGRIFYGN